MFGDKDHLRTARDSLSVSYIISPQVLKMMAIDRSKQLLDLSCIGFVEKIHPIRITMTMAKMRNHSGNGWKASVKGLFQPGR